MRRNKERKKCFQENEKREGEDLKDLKEKRKRKKESIVFPDSSLSLILR